MSGPGHALSLATAAADAYAVSRLPVVVRLLAAKAVLASRLNLSPEHFSRTLRDMSGPGLILVNGRHLTLVNVEGLRALAGTS